MKSLLLVIACEVWTTIVIGLCSVKKYVVHIILLEEDMERQAFNGINVILKLDVWSFNGHE